MGVSLRRRTLGMMFCLGAFSTITQVVLTREMLVVFFGNELTIAVILASWLICVGAGAALSRLIVNRLSVSPLRWILAALGLLLCTIFPWQLYAVRMLPVTLGLSFGEYASLSSITRGAVSVCAPACMLLGFAFPVACAVLDHGDPQSGADPRDVTRVYAWEAVGSMVAGLVVTLVLVAMFPPTVIALLVMGLALLAAGLIVPSVVGPMVGIASAAALLVVATLQPLPLLRMQDALDRLRWQSFGVLSDGGEGVQLVHSEDSIYQNLAVTELSGQYTLYGNGDVLFTFPDPHGDEHAIHFIMAQNPRAKRVLMLGANPLGEIREVLKYPVDRLVYVELDHAIVNVLASVEASQLDAVLSETRVTAVEADGVRYLLACREKFDVVIVNAPAPATAAANRFYTESFFRHVARVLAPGGFMVTSLLASERLMDDAAILGGSVYRTLQAVFDKVLVTAEAEPRLLAGTADAPLTLDRETLYDRSRSAGIATESFLPEYFLGDDALTPEKRAIVRQRFASVPAELNTDMRPVTYFNNLVLWSRFSGSGMTGLLRQMRGLRVVPLVTGMLVLGCVGLLAGVGVRRWGGAGNGARWGRGMMALLLASTGTCGMALEVLLIFVFQSLYGYIYARIGVIVGLFMLGLVMGAPSGRRLAARGYKVTVRCLAGIEIALLGFACLLPMVMRFAVIADRLTGSAWCGEGIIYLCVVAVGWAVGAEFPLANTVLHYAGASVAAAAAVTDASDHLGAAMGALVVGVVLLPVLGIAVTGLVLASLKVAMLLCLGGVVVALRTIRPGSCSRSPGTLRS
jgi:predicted membrane-bound spermidine synthase